ncbi:MAG: prepilin-type N-terminal cleavage/methylation domain-containing protein, partial [Betaproteobacteria bacterium]
MRRISIRLRSSLGFTLVELMVTLAMGLFLAFGLIRVFASSNESYYALSQAAEQIENGRYAIETIKKDL